MGTLVGHLIPGLALIFLGLWHMFNTIKDFHLQGPTKFVSKFWYPFKSPIFILKHSELLVIFFFSVFAIFVQFIDYPFFRFSLKLHNLEHATMFFHLAVYSAFTLFIEFNRISQNLSVISKILALSVFSQELFLLHYHSTDHVGLEGHYHFLLQLIVSLSLITSLITASFPNNFSSAVLLSISVVFQGSWFVNMGFMLWAPKFLPWGCFAEVSDMLGAVICETHKAEMKAKALANMQFSWILGGIMIFTCFVCLVFARRYDKDRGQSIEYEKLQSKGGDVSVVITGFKEVDP